MRRSASAWISGVLTALAVLNGAGARAESPPSDAETLLQRIFADGIADGSWIAPSARGQLTPELMNYVVRAVADAGGALLTVTPAGDDWRLGFERGFTTVALSRDENGLINGIRFGEFIPAGLTLGEAARTFAGLPGEASLIVVAGDDVLAEQNPDAPLLVASSFKLAVLLAVRRAVDSGALAWDRVVTYRTTQASVASGMLDAYPDGTPMTVAGLAAMMISLSDNTATDVLIDLVGRDAVEAAAGLAPVLTTAEFFKLKADAGLYGRYVDGTLAQRRAILEELAADPLPPAGDVTNGRSAHGWRLSVRTMCTLMAEVADLGVMTINPGGLSRADWDRIAFKGGNDVGVTNLTYMVSPHGGVPLCVSVTWNYPDHFNDAQFTSMSNRLLAALREAG